jgi:hypothetical protein
MPFEYQGLLPRSIPAERMLREGADAGGYHRALLSRIDEDVLVDLW